MDHRPTLLQHILPLVPFDGWSSHALTQAAKRAGVSYDDLHKAFPRGADDAIDYFFAAEDDALAHAFSEEALKQKRMPDRIEALVLARLERLAPHKEAVRRAVTRAALPLNGLRAGSSFLRSVDRMWRLAGDTSVDFSYYTKRATLAALYGSTLLYWLNDSSEALEKTKEFLKRGLSGIAAFGRRKAEWKKKFHVA